MNTFDIIALVVTAVGVFSFSIIFTLLYRSYAHSTINEYDVGHRDLELIDETIFENQAHVKTQKKILNAIKRFFFYLFLGLTVPALIFALVTKFNNGIAMIGGKGIIVVASGSMSEKNPANGYILSNNLTNQFNTYDIIVLEDVKNKELELYDVIAFIDDKGTNIIHRIVGFTDDGKFITRGDSNNADDTYRPSKSDVLGRYVGTRMQYIGVFVMFFQSYSGMITLVAIIYCLIMIDRFTDKIHDAQERRLELLSSAINFKDELECEDLASEMTQKIYFKGFEYIFNDEGFVDKREISDEELKLKSEGCMIKETSNASGVITSEDIQIPTAELEDGDGEYDEEEKDDDKEEKES